jgi:hypothetical protein
MVADVWKHRGLRVAVDTAKHQGPRVAADVLRVVVGAAGTAVEVGLREADTAAKVVSSMRSQRTNTSPPVPTVGFLH